MNKVLDISEKQVLRGRLLKICEQSDPVGSCADVACTTLHQYGFNQFNKEDITKAYRYLADKGFVRIEKAGSGNVSLQIAHITAKGIDVLEGTITAEGIELL